MEGITNTPPDNPGNVTIGPTIKSLAELSYFVKDKCPCGKYIFRGQGNHDPKHLRLMPTLARTSEELSIDPLVFEREMLLELRALTKPFLIKSSSVLDDWDLLVLAQHHHMSTRLLDWTWDPLIAAYFAVHNETDRPQSHIPGAIWALEVTPSLNLDCSVDKPWKIRTEKLLRPKSSDFTARIGAQKSVLVACPNPLLPAFPDLLLPSLDYTPRNHPMLQITIPKEYFPKIENELKQRKINKSRLLPNLDPLYPDLDALCRDLEGKLKRKFAPKTKAEIHRTQS